MAIVCAMLPFIFGQSACEQRLAVNNPRLAKMLSDYQTSTDVGMLYNSDLEIQEVDSVGHFYVPGFYIVFSGDDVVFQESTVVHSGVWAIGITKRDGTYDTMFYSGGQPECECIPWTRVFPGETIEFEFWTAGNEGFYSIETAMDEVIVPKTPTGRISEEYFPVIGEFVVPVNCEYLRIYLYAPQYGTVYYDDIQLRAKVQ